eukprot:gene22162-biopygen19228
MARVGAASLPLTVTTPETTAPSVPFPHFSVVPVPQMGELEHFPNDPTQSRGAGPPAACNLERRNLQLSAATLRVLRHARPPRLHHVVRALPVTVLTTRTSSDAVPEQRVALLAVHRVANSQACVITPRMRGGEHGAQQQGAGQRRRQRQRGGRRVVQRLRHNGRSCGNHWHGSLESGSSAVGEVIIFPMLAATSWSETRCRHNKTPSQRMRGGRHGAQHLSDTTVDECRKVTLSSGTVRRLRGWRPTRAQRQGAGDVEATATFNPEVAATLVAPATLASPAIGAPAALASPASLMTPAALAGPAALAAPEAPAPNESDNRAKWIKPRTKNCCTNKGGGERDSDPSPGPVGDPGTQPASDSDLCQSAETQADSDPPNFSFALSLTQAQPGPRSSPLFFALSLTQAQP